MVNLMYRVLIDDRETGQDDYVRSEDGEPETHRDDRYAAASAERLAEEYFGGDDATWFERDDITTPHGVFTYRVGRIHEDGTLAGPTVFITVEEVEAGTDEPVEAEAIDDVTPTNKPE